MSQVGNIGIGYKIILLGESSVGKTSIITRLTKNRFMELSISTISEYFTEKKIEINGTPLKLEIWDTAGQEKYRSLIRNYYNGCDAAILVYDIAERNTFNEVQNYWYKEIKKNCPNIILGIAANKFDLFEREQVTEKEGKDFANEIGAIFYSTSAKENVGIDALFKDIATKLLESDNKSVSFNNDTLSKLSSQDTSKKKCC